MRKCGGCTLCCTLVPVHELSTKFDLAKPAGVRCPHVRTGHGCRVYNDPPACCRAWSCRWLLGDLPEGMGRPDRAGYVVDQLLDLVIWQDNETDERHEFPAVQIWLSPRLVAREFKPDRHLENYINLMVDKGYAVLLREDSGDAMTLVKFRGHYIQQAGKAVIKSSEETFLKAALLETRMNT